MNINDLETKINRVYGRLSKGQRLLATYITENYDKAAFLTAQQLGKSVGVSESTVIRFALHLGYKGYPDFQKALEDTVKNKLSNIKKEEFAYENVKSSDILQNILNTDALRIKHTAELIDPKAFEAAISMILNAKCVYIIGLRSSAPLASYFGYYLNFILKDVKILTSLGSEELLEQMYHISNEDLIFGISFPQYSMRTLKALEFSNQRNAKVVTLTDSIHSPISLYSSCNLIAKSDMSYIVESMTAPFSVIHALLAGLCAERKEELEKTMNQIEQIWDDYKVFGNDDMEYLEDRVKVHYTNAKKATGDLNE